MVLITLRAADEVRAPLFSNARWTPVRRRSISGPDLPHTGSVAGGGTADILASARSRLSAARSDDESEITKRAARRC
jgi:hypothetical protein